MRVVELFAGVGGFRVGLENASDEFETVWANQWEPSTKVQHAFECYKTHFEDAGGVNEWSNVDISIAKEHCPDHDLLVGGFPCQNYSVAASLKSAKGIEGEKGVLWWEIRAIAEAHRPKFLLLENVDRLLKSPASQRGRDFGIMLQTLNELGYAVEWRVINAAEYGKVQRRRRTFIFAYHKDTNFYNDIHNQEMNDIILHNGMMAQTFSCEINEAKQPVRFNLNEFEGVGDISEHFHCLFKNAGVMIDGEGLSIEVTPIYNGYHSVLNDIVEHNVDDAYFLSESEKADFDYLRGGKRIKRTKPNGEEYYYSEGSMSPHDDLQLPGRTMLTSEGSKNRSTHIIMDPDRHELRKLTQVECERLNGFPDNWTNTGMTPKFRYFTMGNALVVPLITMMGQTISRIAENEDL